MQAGKDWTIEDDVPIPPKGTHGRTSGLAEVFRNLNVGQSIHFTNSPREAISGSYSRVSRHWGHKFVARSTPDGLRVWRVE